MKKKKAVKKTAKKKTVNRAKPKRKAIMAKAKNKPVKVKKQYARAALNRKKYTIPKIPKAIPKPQKRIIKSKKIKHKKAKPKIAVVQQPLALQPIAEEIKKIEATQQPIEEEMEFEIIRQHPMERRYLLLREMEKPILQSIAGVVFKRKD